LNDSSGALLYSGANKRFSAPPAPRLRSRRSLNFDCAGQSQSPFLFDLQALRLCLSVLFRARQLRRLLRGRFRKSDTTSLYFGIFAQGTTMGVSGSESGFLGTEVPYQ
jgi:hypothetical protein